MKFLKNILSIQKKKILLFLILDFSFLALLFLAFYSFKKLLEDYANKIALFGPELQEIYTQLSQSTELNTVELALLNAKLSQISMYLTKLYIISALIFLALFVAWCFIEGFNWKLSRNALNFKEKKLKKKKNYLLQFFLISLIWLIVSVILIKILSILVPRPIDILTFISVFVLTFYFSTIAFTYIDYERSIWQVIKSGFLTALKKRYILFPVVLVLVILFLFAIGLNTYLLSFAVWPLIAFIISLLVLLVAVSLYRTFTLTYIKNLE